MSLTGLDVSERDLTDIIREDDETYNDPIRDDQAELGRMLSLDEEIARANTYSASAMEAILLRSVCFRLSLDAWGINRRLPTDQIDTKGADQAWVRASKKLVECAEYKAVKKLDGQIRMYLYSVALPSPFGRGVHVIPIALLQAVQERLKAYQADRQRKVEAFLDAYEGAILEAQGKLGPAFNPSNYPSAPRLSQLFRMTWNFVTLATPDSLPAKMFAEEREKARAQWAEAQAEMRALLRVSMADLVDHLIDRLSGGDDGKPKVFRDSLVENMREFLGTFEARNLTDDVQLKAVVERAQGLLGGVTPELLRKSDEVKGSVAQGFTELKGELDGMLEDAPIRKFRLQRKGGD